MNVRLNKISNEETEEIIRKGNFLEAATYLWSKACDSHCENSLHELLSMSSVIKCIAENWKRFPDRGMSFSEKVIEMCVELIADDYVIDFNLLERVIELAFDRTLTLNNLRIALYAVRRVNCSKHMFDLLELPDLSARLNILYGLSEKYGKFQIACEMTTYTKLCDLQALRRECIDMDSISEVYDVYTRLKEARKLSDERTLNKSSEIKDVLPAVFIADEISHMFNVSNLDETVVNTALVLNDKNFNAEQARAWLNVNKEELQALMVENKPVTGLWEAFI